jgi:hypothetical protein
LRKIESFISDSDKSEIISYVSGLKRDSKIDNLHIGTVASKLRGDSFMFDISRTEISAKLSNFQSSNNLVNLELPEIIYHLLDKISTTLGINKDHVFLQILVQDRGGLIHPHYDSSIDGWITYKCNISVQSENYILFIDSDQLNIKEGDLYCFEASLYKHWTNPFTNKRIILSFGFILPYRDLGRDENCPRVRLSRRILKYFQEPSS